MFSEQRILRLKNYLQEHQQVDVVTLGAVLSISVSTLRRDLKKLETEGFLSRYHGGVITNEKAADPLYYLYDDPHIELKKQVGMTAATLVNDGDIIFIGAGNSCWQMSKHLKAARLTVVTHSFNVAMELEKYHDYRIIFLGGDVELENRKAYTSGSFAFDMLKNIFIEKSFFPVNGVSIENGYSLNSNYLADLYIKLFDYTTKMIPLADYTKFDKCAFRPIFNFLNIKHLITNKNIPERYKSYCKEHDITLYTDSTDP
jgi:DeoR/GlpR family transcriptional regulator of sugar metabolism